jgi:hypothetical protein
MHPAIDNLPPIHPGEILKEELEALLLSARKFAQHIQAPPWGAHPISSRPYQHQAMTLTLHQSSASPLMVATSINYDQTDHLR